MTAVSDEQVEATIYTALALLPKAMTSKEACVFMYAAGWQESEFAHRYQVVQGKPGAKGPARSLWQFELGTQESKGGVWGVFLHPASRYWLAELCEWRGVKFQPRAIWLAIENDDVLAAGLARLLMFTDPKRLPSVDDEAGAWTMYAKRLWRPGKPHPKKWPEAWRRARAVILD